MKQCEHLTMGHCTHLFRRSVFIPRCTFAALRVTGPPTLVRYLVVVVVNQQTVTEHQATTTYDNDEVERAADTGMAKPMNATHKTLCPADGSSTGNFFLGSTRLAPGLNPLVAGRATEARPGVSGSVASFANLA